ncbi:hypothetical protein CDL15_Pgr026935 [Punica granatum]|uniref:carotenoid 9,10-dioxygenase n=1 Tax=Punica granatum TaxID=22663 RepID=A0A218Y0E0_PUNGR|nr:hypothetical protein CDL15_Pgr026935 [Punica granatum]
MATLWLYGRGRAAMAEKLVEEKKQQQLSYKGRARPPGIVLLNPKPSKGLTSKILDCAENLIVKLTSRLSSHSPRPPLHYLSGNFGPVSAETPPVNDLPVRGHLPDCLNGEFMRVGPNPRFVPIAGYHWFDGDGFVLPLPCFIIRYYIEKLLHFSSLPIGDLKGVFGLLVVLLQMLRASQKALDVSYGFGTGNTALVYHHGKLLALQELDKPSKKPNIDLPPSWASIAKDVLKVLEDGDLLTLGIMDYEKRLAHPFTAHPKVDPVTGEMFTFGCSLTPPYVTYRVISKDGFMHDPVPITIPAPILMHDFAITDRYAIFMDLPFYFRPMAMVKENKLPYVFDPMKKARFGVLPRYAKNEHEIRWFELPSCFIFHNANAWEEGDEVVLITGRCEDLDLEMFNGPVKEEVIPRSFRCELYEMRFNLTTGLASQKKLSESVVNFPSINETYTGRKSSVYVADAKTMSADPVAVVDLPNRVPYGFHGLFLTEKGSTTYNVKRTKVYIKSG